MSAIYYRRWTRMWIKPAFKYFHRYGVLTPGYESMMHLMNQEDPNPENKRYIRYLHKDKDEELNNKLIEDLFRKYPDLKYESISRHKYHGDQFNSYSYAHAFITEQKKLIKAGYKPNKAFELVEAKFQDKMKRKLDQTLLSRGLAVGNRARSFLTIYQQQVEYESRIKMMRTQREVLKYEKKLSEVKAALLSPNVPQIRLRNSKRKTTTREYSRRSARHQKRREKKLPNSNPMKHANRWSAGSNPSSRICSRSSTRERGTATDSEG